MLLKSQLDFAASSPTQTNGSEGKEEWINGK
jgi:hypothetical protein